jgi:alpha-amylase
MYFNYKKRRHPVTGMALAALALIGCQALQPTPEHPGMDLSPVPLQAAPSALPEGWHHGAFMEIFVRGWKDSNGDGIGDLKGLTQTLDDLHELGIKGLWLMPIQPNADGDHGYAPTDFRGIAPEYGTLADFDELLKQAHARGIGVITDYVINHAAADFPLFKRAAQSPNDRFRSWFVWEPQKPLGWKIWDQDPWYATPTGHYFGTFGPHMPDFNFRNREVLEYHRSNLRFWLNRGLDGFRLDAVPHLVENSARDWNDQPESRRLTAEFTQLIKAYPHRYVMCEATAEPQVYGADNLCGGAFAFGYVQHIREAALGKAASVPVLAEYFKTAPRGMATFLSSHDAWAGRRMMDEMRGDETAYRLAAATYLLQPGTPFIYYGEEVGMRGLPTLQGDPAVRGPMSWTPDAARAGFTTGQPYRAAAPNAATHNLQMQRADPASLFHHYKAMLALRNNLPSVARGSFEQARAQGQVLTWQRQWQQERSVVVINYGDAPQPLVLEGLGAGQAYRAAYPVAASGLQANAAGAAQVAVPARSVQVWVR